MHSARRHLLKLGTAALLPRPNRPAPAVVAVSASDRLALLQMAFGEVRGQPLAGIVAALQVPLNRVASRHALFARDHDVRAAVERPGQFQGWCPRLVVDAADQARIEPLVDIAVSLWRRGVDLSGGAQFFGRSTRAPAPGAIPTVRIEAHQYWRLPDVA